MNNVIAVDLGASSGRVILVGLEDGSLTFEELHRFPNEPIERKGQLFWDIDYILNGIKQGIQMYHNTYDAPVQGIGIDTWGVDVGFLDQNYNLIDDPYSYRGSHSLDAMPVIHEKLSPKQLFMKTGVESAAINSLYQIEAIFKDRPKLKSQTAIILTLPSLVGFLLTGKTYNEFTHASTTQLLDPETQDWSTSVMKTVYSKALPFAPIKKTNTIVGDTREQLNKSLGINPIPVINVPGHDTACAHVAMPLVDKNTVFMSCGTWVLIGVEVDKPIVTENAYNWGFTNEGTPDLTYRLQKNNMGLWLLQQCKKEWEENGEAISYDDERKLLEESEPFMSFIDPDDERFFNPSSMTKAIEQFCKDTNQPIPQSKGAFIRCILESLAMKYRWIVERLESLTAKHLPSIHMAGGGIQNIHLCQFTANATSRKVTTGPIEASAIGNALSQFITLGICENLQEARSVSRRSFRTNNYKPEETENWEEAYQAFLSFLHN